MPLPEFLDGTPFNGEEIWWVVINGEVRRGEVDSPHTKPYLASFGRVARSDCTRFSWSQQDIPVTFWFAWVWEGYRTKRDALTAQRELRCPCEGEGERGTLRFTSHHGTPTAVGVYCSKCWEELLKATRGINMAGPGE